MSNFTTIGLVPQRCFKRPTNLHTDRPDGPGPAACGSVWDEARIGRGGRFSSSRRLQERPAACRCHGGVPASLTAPFVSLYRSESVGEKRASAYRRLRAHLVSLENPTLESSFAFVFVFQCPSRQPLLMAIIAGIMAFSSRFFPRLWSFSNVFYRWLYSL